MTSFVILLSLVAILGLVLGGAYVRYRRYRRRLEDTAKGVCDPGSWRVGFQGRTLLIKGHVDGRSICYSVFGDERRKEPVNSYLLLGWPVQRNFRFYAESDPDMADEEIRPALAQLQEEPGFRGLIATSRTTPFLARLISRPFGFGYDPGLLLWKCEAAVLEKSTIQRNLDLLLWLGKLEI